MVWPGPRSGLLRSGVTIVSAMALWACASSPSVGTPSPPASASPSSLEQTPTPTATASLTATPPPPTPLPTTSGAIRFESVKYPYALTLPAAIVQRNWHPAQRAWDGLARIEMAGPYTDNIGVVDGGLHIFGTSAPDGARAFYRLVVDNAKRFHGCTEPTDAQDLMVNEATAVSYTQTCVGQPFARIVLVQDGFGLAAFIAVGGVTQAQALEHLTVWLRDLEWRTS